VHRHADRQRTHPDDTAIPIAGGVLRSDGSTEPHAHDHTTVMPLSEAARLSRILRERQQGPVARGQDRPLPWIRSSLWLMT